ncbi:MAG TPA: ANTAR domain-containing protein [Nocardioidaceae bacterium]|nr:ANTAR domain-containing protein [Nocardioidaceae bacterium]
MHRPLERSQHDPVFLSLPSPILLLNRDFTIAAANRSYLRTTGRCAGDLVGRNVFDAFPESPASKEAGTTADFASSVDRVCRTQRPHRLSGIRFDVPDPDRPGEFLTKSWSVVNAPVCDGDGVAGVIVRVEDLSMVDEDVVATVRAYQDVVAVVGHERPGQVDSDEVDAVVDLLENYSEIAAEIAQLREALKTRPVIEQAKGIIMADRKCCPDEAFRVLKRLSMDTNVRIADVAAAVVYQRAGAREPSTGTAS